MRVWSPPRLCFPRDSATRSPKPRPQRPSSMRCRRGVAASSRRARRELSSHCVRFLSTTSRGAPLTKIRATSADIIRVAEAPSARRTLIESGTPSRLSMQSMYSTSRETQLSKSVPIFLFLVGAFSQLLGSHSTSLFISRAISRSFCFRASRASARLSSSSRALAQGPRVRASLPPTWMLYSCCSSSSSVWKCAKCAARRRATFCIA
mmetsp:Transcript_34549/g.81903  ORF Transcript_34549/g.81903 Transcript_34549/m.81903 type:complete len:207 (+) Transcript_34549:848-1468(+)